jgi:putative transposase
MTFKEIEDDLWELIRPYLPPQKPKTGRPRANLRKLFNGILYVLKTGCTWADVPKEYGTKSTVHRLHQELSNSGTYEKISDFMLSEGYETGKIDLSSCFTDTKDIPAKKGAKSAMMGIKR